VNINLDLDPSISY